MQRECANAGKKIGDAPGFADMPSDQSRQRCLALCGRLQKCTCRQRYLRLADLQMGLRSLGHKLAMTGKTNEVMHLSDMRECCEASDIQCAGAAHVDVEAGIGRGHLDVERLAGRLKRLGNGPGCLDGAAEAGRQDRARVDGDDMMCAWCGETDLHDIADPGPGVQYGAPT